MAAAYGRDELPWRRRIVDLSSLSAHDYAAIKQRGKLFYGLTERPKDGFIKARLGKENVKGAKQVVLKKGICIELPGSPKSNCRKLSKDKRKDGGFVDALGPDATGTEEREDVNGTAVKSKKRVRHPYDENGDHADEYGFLYDGDGLADKLMKKEKSKSSKNPPKIAPTTMSTSNTDDPPIPEYPLPEVDPVRATKPQLTAVLSAAALDLPAQSEKTEFYVEKVNSEVTPRRERMIKDSEEVTRSVRKDRVPKGILLAEQFQGVVEFEPRKRKQGVSKIGETIVVVDDDNEEESLGSRGKEEKGKSGGEDTARNTEVDCEQDLTLSDGNVSPSPSVPRIKKKRKSVAPGAVGGDAEVLKTVTPSNVTPSTRSNRGGDQYVPSPQPFMLRTTRAHLDFVGTDEPPTFEAEHMAMRKTPVRRESSGDALTGAGSTRSKLAPCRSVTPTSSSSSSETLADSIGADESKSQQKRPSPSRFMDAPELEKPLQFTVREKLLRAKLNRMEVLLLTREHQLRSLQQENSNLLTENDELAFALDAASDKLNAWDDWYNGVGVEVDEDGNGDEIAVEVEEGGGESLQVETNAPLLTEEVDVPQPAVPQPGVPQPAVSQPVVPQPVVPQLAVPTSMEISVPNPSAPGIHLEVPRRPGNEGGATSNSIQPSGIITAIESGSESGFSFTTSARPSREQQQTQSSWQLEQTAGPPADADGGYSSPTPTRESTTPTKSMQLQPSVRALPHQGMSSVLKVEGEGRKDGEGDLKRESVLDVLDNVDVLDDVDALDAEAGLNEVEDRVVEEEIDKHYLPSATHIAAMTTDTEGRNISAQNAGVKPLPASVASRWPKKPASGEDPTPPAPRPQRPTAGPAPAQHTKATVEKLAQEVSGMSLNGGNHNRYAPSQAQSYKAPQSQSWADWDGFNGSPAVKAQVNSHVPPAADRPSAASNQRWTPSPRNPAMERKLFGSRISSGINFDNYDKIPVQTSGYNIPRPLMNFQDADLHPLIKENIQLAGYTKPTPVQKYALTIVNGGRDLMACAQTGSGKTAAFLFPILSHAFKEGPTNSNQYRRCAYPQTLILAPTRELACQIMEEARKFAYRSWVRPVVVYGGADAFPQMRELGQGCQLLVATPGRLIDMLERGVVSLTGVRYLILDEADRMLDMGFEPQIRRIVEEEGMPKKRQTLLFSATFPRQIQQLASDFLTKNYIFLTIGRVGGAAEDVDQRVVEVRYHEKREKLYEVLRSDRSLRANPPSLTLVFVKTKRNCDAIGYFLQSKNVPVAVIHGDRTQPERERSLKSFKTGQTPILIATDVASRGLDIPNVTHVINFDLPQGGQIDDYVHRIGIAFFLKQAVPVEQATLAAPRPSTTAMRISASPRDSSRFWRTPSRQCRTSCAAPAALAEEDLMVAGHMVADPTVVDPNGGGSYGGGGGRSRYGGFDYRAAGDKW
ncbi:hypothetical protein HDV00_000961 [Rhizophlyctis rosea]|nr:hypothetical protein HDV00_000961 [Rhizophlyctis rosea]